MIPEQQVREIAQKLLERSGHGEVVWTESVAEEDVFEVRLPKSSVRIESDASGGDRIIALELCNEIGRCVGRLRASLMSRNEDFTLLAKLYDDAKARATRWQSVLQDVTSAIENPGTIGARP